MQKESRFHKSARKLKSPLSTDYNEEHWQNCFATCGASTDDARIIHATRYFASWAESIRDLFSLEQLNELGAADASLLGIALANAVYFNNSRSIDAKIKSALGAGALSFDALVGQPVETPFEGVRISTDDLNESSIDSLESWLFDTSKLPLTESNTVNYDEACAFAALRYSIQHGMNDLWNGVFWDDLEVVENETTIRIGPKDSYNYKLTRAWF